MKMQKSNIAYNLTTLRQLNKFSQEEVAERIGKQANQYPIS